MTEEQKPTIEEVKKNKTKSEIIAAFDAYKRGEPNSLDKLLVLVNKFAHTKVSHVEYDLQHGGGYADAEDWAQEVSIKVWEKLSEFEGDGAGFYAWVHKIAFNKASAVFNELKRVRDTT